MQSGRWARVSGTIGVTHRNIVARDGLSEGAREAPRRRECTELIGATITHPRVPAAPRTSPYNPCVQSPRGQQTGREPRAVRCLAHRSPSIHPSTTLPSFRPMLINSSDLIRPIPLCLPSRNNVASLLRCIAIPRTDCPPRGPVNRSGSDLFFRQANQLICQISISCLADPPRKSRRERKLGGASRRFRGDPAAECRRIRARRIYSAGLVFAGTRSGIPGKYYARLFTLRVFCLSIDGGTGRGMKGRG